MKKNHILISGLITAIVTAAIVITWGFTLEERAEFLSPDKKHKGIISRYRHLNFTFRAFPGSGSDYPCFLSIYDVDTGKNMGTAPVGMATWAHDLVWTKTGARIPVASGPEWDFSQGTCAGRPDHGTKM